MLSELIIAISFSIDALAVGFSYTLQQIRISHAARLLIGVITLLVFEASAFLGYLGKHFFPTEILEFVGLSLLILVGLEFIRTGLFTKSSANFDWNHSKDINFGESCALALSLSLDSVCAGIATVVIGVNVCRMGIMIGAMQTLFLSIGIILAKHLGRLHILNQKVCSVFSGILLIVLACVRLIR